MGIIDWITRYSKALIDGTAWKNYERMNNDDARDLMLKVFAVAVTVGIVTAFVVPVLVAVVAIGAGLVTFSYDTVNYDFAAAAVKQRSASGRK